MPVRVKQRALVAQDVGEQDRFWDDLRNTITALLVFLRSPLSLHVKNSVTNKRLNFNSSQQYQRPPVLSEGDSPALSSTNRLALAVLHQAGQIAPSAASEWIPASASSQSMAIKGIISLNPAPTKSIQYISLGLAPLICSEHNLIYDHINHIFGRSRFGTLEADPVSEAERVRRAHDRRFKQDNFTRTQMASEKGIDRWPMFILQIEFKDKACSTEEITRSEAMIVSILQVMDALVTSWLSAHHFRPRKQFKVQNSHRPDDSHNSSSSQSRSTSQDMVTTLDVPLTRRSETTLVAQSSSLKPQPQHTRVRPSTGVTTSDEISKATSSRRDDEPAPLFSRPGSAPIVCATTFEFSSKQIITVAPRTPRIHIESVPASNLTSTPRHSSHQTRAVASTTAHEHADLIPALAVDTIVDWTDPITKQSHNINARTGAIEPPSKPAIEPSSSIQSRRGRPERRMLLTHRDCAKEPAPSEWLDGVLANWHNPVFHAPEEGITQASFDLPCADGGYAKETWRAAKEAEQAFSDVSQLDARTISKQAFSKAKVIAQVDDKFILVLLEGGNSMLHIGSSRLLVAIDQHAADERCKVEQLLQELCSEPCEDDAVYTSDHGHRSAIATTSLSKAIKFTIPDREAELFEQHAGAFADWGILYDVETSGTHPTLVVRCLPPAIAERCRLEPKVLVSLLRSELWRRVEDGRPSTRHRVLGDLRTRSKKQAWIDRISGCPKDILDMVNSRACRSAIMFNDTLTIQQCKELVERLARCDFPFQCAHGRPSMVPLIDLGTMGDFKGDEMGFEFRLANSIESRESSYSDFAAAFNEWVT